MYKTENNYIVLSINVIKQLSSYKVIISHEFLPHNCRMFTLFYRTIFSRYCIIVVVVIRKLKRSLSCRHKLFDVGSKLLHCRIIICLIQFFNSFLGSNAIWLWQIALLPWRELSLVSIYYWLQKVPKLGRWCHLTICI